jgi:hypothetical protein
VGVGRDAWPEAPAETRRIAACSDGEDAIVMMLVVLDLRPPSPCSFTVLWGVLQ